MQAPLIGFRKCFCAKAEKTHQPKVPSNQEPEADIADQGFVQASTGEVRPSSTFPQRTPVEEPLDGNEGLQMEMATLRRSPEPVENPVWILLCFLNKTGAYTALHMPVPPTGTDQEMFEQFRNEDYRHRSRMAQFFNWKAVTKIKFVQVIVPSRYSDF